MQFLYPSLTWAFLLVLVPLLIHLINLLRQRRIQWAAMEFLLQSNKKHRRWVWLKQLILLLLRMFVIAVVIAMLAGLVTRDQASFLGAQPTHHFILLDDSLSMADRTSSGRAFDMANQALRRIAEQLASQPADHKVTLIRFSEATKSSGSVQGAGSIVESLAELNAVTVDSDFVETMEETRRKLDIVELAVGPTGALEMVDRLMKNAAEPHLVAYLVSDFRAKEWDQSAELKELLRAVRKNDSELHLIRCVAGQNQNLAIIEVEPDRGTLAAGVPLLVNIQVRNFGPDPAQQVAIRVSARSYPSDALVADHQVKETQISTLTIDEIPAGEVATRQAQLKFDRAGQHIVAASLGSDALVEDNVSRCLIDIPAVVPVLIVDGSADGDEAYYLESVFAPGRIVTGINPVARDPSYLRDVTDNELQQYAAIYLLNVERLDAKAVAGLSRYVRSGGGLGMFAGPNTDPAFLLEMYANGEGLFPLAVQTARNNRRPNGDETPDLQVNDHPIFRALVDSGGESRPLARLIRIDRFLGVDPDWQPGESPKSTILATVRNSDPVVVSRPFGAGQVVVFLTTASPTWNNWAMGPTYPVVILQLHGFLASGRQAFRSGLTGEPITLQLDTTEYRPEVEFVMPAAPNVEATTISLEANETTQNGTVVSFEIGRDPLTGERTGLTDRSGVYLANLRSLDGQRKQTRFVKNVPTTDSELSILAPRDLANQLDELGIQFHNADDLDYGSAQQDGVSWAQLLAGLLVVLLLGEQLFAYSASYHPKGGNGRG